MTMELVLIDRRGTLVANLDPDPVTERQIFTATMITYQGKPYGYHRLTGKGAVFMQVDPPVDVSHLKPVIPRAPSVGGT